MNEVKERTASPTGASKKVCPRAARENAKIIEVTQRLHKEKSVEKKTNAGSSSSSSSTTDSKKIEVLMDTFKISKSEECRSREKSPLRKEMPNSPVVERLTTKKGCTRCSRCSKTPNEEKNENKPLKVPKDQDLLLKTIKKGSSSTKTERKIPKTPSPPPVKKQCSKLAKFQVELHEKTVKSKSILVHNEKAALKENKKIDVSKNGEAPQSPKPCKRQKKETKLAKLLSEPQEKNVNAKKSFAHTEKIHSRAHESSEVSKICEKSSLTTMKSIVVKSHSEIEKKVEFAWPNSGIPEDMDLSSETSLVEGKLGIVNGSEPLAVLDTKVCLLNGSHDEHLCDPHLGLESPGGTKRELASKIPRKTNALIGMKPDGSLNKDTMPEELIAL